MINTYSEAIRKLRAKMDLSQEALAKKLGVVFSSVNRWENGHNEPTIKIKRKIKELCQRENIDIDSTISEQ